MLVLTRRVGEEIVIGGDVRIIVVAVRGGKVRLGVTAPPSIHVARQELLTECSQIETQRRATSTPTPVKYEVGNPDRT